MGLCPLLHSPPPLFFSPLRFYPLVSSISHLLALSIIPLPAILPYSRYLYSSTICITHHATQRLDSSIANAVNYQFLLPYRAPPPFFFSALFPNLMRLVEVRHAGQNLKSVRNI